MDHPIISGTQEYIQALWAHLLSNAIRYTQPGGRITISLQENSRERKIIGTVSDTGIGISPEEIPRVFEEFYRTKEAKAMQETGTGLRIVPLPSKLSPFTAVPSKSIQQQVGAALFVLSSPRLPLLTGTGHE